MLTEAEKKWLEEREKWNSKSGYYLTPGVFPNKTLYRVTEYADYRDAAEFEARVAAWMADNLPSCDFCKWHTECLDTSCARTRLKHARLAVEKEMP